MGSERGTYVRTVLYYCVVCRLAVLAPVFGLVFVSGVCVDGMESMVYRTQC
jgi:hypothetical protein